MNKRITKLFTCCLNNKVVVIDTNLENFITKLSQIEPKCKSYRWFLYKLQESPNLDFPIEDKRYFIQRLV